ncbi:MAG: glycosyltransferase family 4 protein [Nitrospira sp. CG24D]|nr:MAG: glycosyltransferase family 4 protein [Nitrospira sp. CG24D]
MKILLLAEVSAERVIGGAERVLRQQAVGLIAAGHQVDLLTRAMDETVSMQVAISGAKEWRFPVSKKSEWSFVRSTVQGALSVLDRLTRKATYDLAIIHQALTGFGPLYLRRKAAAEWLYVCHSLAHEEYLTRTAAATSLSSRLRRHVNAWARRGIEWLVMSRCHRIVVLSEFMRQRVMATHGIAPERIVLIPGAADPNLFRPAADRRELRRTLGLPEDRTILFTVRNLVPRMGLETLLDALSELGQGGRHCLLVIGGEGPLRARLEAGIRQRQLEQVVRLVGFIPDEQLVAYYQAADLVLMPTAQLEGFGLVTVEALACGTPVVGTPVGAIPEVLGQIDPILISSGTDSGSFADALVRVLSRIEEPVERERLSRKGRSLVERRYNWVQHCADLILLSAKPASERKAA